MKIYYLTVKLTNNGFEYSSKEAEQDKWYNPSYDVYNVHDLETYYPSVWVATLDPERIEQYKKDMCDFITNNLKERIVKLEKLLTYTTINET